MTKKTPEKNQIGGFEKTAVPDFRGNRRRGVAAQLVDALKEMVVGDAISVPMSRQNAHTIAAIVGLLLTRQYRAHKTPEKNACVVSRVS